MKPKFLSLVTLLSTIFIITGCTVDVNPDKENANQPTEVGSVPSKYSNLCNTESGKKGFIMSDGKCYAPGENVMDTDCIVSATGGCESLDR